ncbi:MAG: hemolysin family protein [Myxococcota bacterium]|nr:hemolysin family protein [Myxococcota bacterium]
MAIPVAASSPWLLSVFLIFACAIYVAFEFALVKIPMRTLERDASTGAPGAAILLGMKRDMNAMLAACQFGITITSLGLTLALEPAIHHALLGYELVARFSAVIAMAVGAFFHVTFGELVPKGLALVVPGKVLYATAPFMRIFRFLAIPFIKTCNAIANVIVATITGKNPDTAGHHDEGVDIGEALVYAHASGEIKPEQLTLMRNVLSFADRTAREVMTPARRVTTLDLQHSWNDNMAVVEEQGFSRLPVLDGDPHNVVGYVRRADILRAALHGKRELAPLVLPIERRPETASLARLDMFAGTPMIAVFDEHDSFTGLLTAEDLVEQIVGEIYDDTDEPASPDVVTLENGEVRMAGAVLLEKAADVLAVPSIAGHEDVDTIGGLVVKKLGRMPKAGDHVVIDGYDAHVESCKGFRIGQLLLRPTRAEP